MSLDNDLRAALFAQMALLRGRFGDRIPRSAIDNGVVIDGDRIPIWNRYQGIHKPAVLGRNGAALTIQTSADSPYEDSHDPQSAHFIYKYRGSDASHPDNAALRTAMLERKPLLYLVAVDPGFYDAIWPVYIVGDEPLKQQVVMVADQASSASESAATDSAIYRREYYTRAVMTRLHQVHFRRRVLRAYREACAICRLRHVNLLDAAHILPDAHPLGEPVVSNGLGLCKIHHSAFDSNILGIDPRFVVHIREDVLAERDGPMLKHGLQELHGVALTIPRKQSDQPNREFLGIRFSEFTQA